jgi:hypothetical protein
MLRSSLYLDSLSVERMQFAVDTACCQRRGVWRPSASCSFVFNFPTTATAAKQFNSCIALNTVWLLFNVHHSTGTTAAAAVVAAAARGVAALTHVACQRGRPAVKHSCIPMAALAPAVVASTGWSVRQKQQSRVSLSQQTSSMCPQHMRPCHDERVGSCELDFSQSLYLCAARQLLASIHRHGRLDFDCSQPDPRFDLDMLFTKGPGRMIGAPAAELSAK